MTDKELLELAAKAADIPIFEWCEDERDDSWHGARADSEEATVYWSPLTDDGDALRLAVKLGITIDLVDCSAYRRTTDRLIQEYWGGDYDPSCRRAIVRAAAEMAKVPA